MLGFVPQPNLLFQLSAESRERWCEDWLVLCY